MSLINADFRIFAPFSYQKTSKVAWGNSGLTPTVSPCYSYVLRRNRAEKQAPVYFEITTYFIYF